MEKIQNNEENMLFRFAKSNRGKLAGVILLSFSTVEAARIASDIVNEDYNDTRTSAVLGMTELSIGTAIFAARRTGVSKESTQENGQ